MPECPACLGEGEWAFIHAQNRALERLAAACRVPFFPMDPVCDICEGDGEVTEDEARDYQARMTARVDQFTAAVDSGEIRIA
jgi:hypothetical protein